MYFQGARSLRDLAQVTLPDLGENIDVLSVSAVGIASKVNRQDLKVVRIGKLKTTDRESLRLLAADCEELDYTEAT